MKLLEEYLKKLNIPYDNTTIDKFSKYYELLIHYNKMFNLTSITEKEEVIIKHFVDSLYGYQFFKKNNRVVDVGAGAGFPSIPLAIVLSDVNFTLIDSLNKRVNFLNIVKEELNLSNVTAIHTRVEDFCSKNRNTFDISTARAVASLPTLLEYLIPLLKVNGKAICYKSLNVENEIAMCDNAFKKLYCKIENKYDYNIEDNFRSIVIVKSIQECNKCYPRSGNKPKTKPLL